MTFDDGILTIYKTENIANPGNKPVIGLIEKNQAYFGFETIGINRYYTALQAKQQIDTLVHIWQDRGIAANDICILESGKQYRIVMVQHMDNDGLRITKLSMERLVEEYDMECTRKAKR